jgi:hypothetical protein
MNERRDEGMRERKMKGRMGERERKGKNRQSDGRKGKRE